MYLHENRELFEDVIIRTAENIGKNERLIEKDYYVTQILRCLAEQMPNCVFKGGTSLSKGFHVIDRFSEDIDITFDEYLGENRRWRLKNESLKKISEDLGMPIINWSDTQSDRDYNAYLFSYDSVFGIADDRMQSTVRLETALGSYAFPTVLSKIGNYIGDFLNTENRNDLTDLWSLQQFQMKLQSLERTYIDKIFALCDYYMESRSKRCSRHLYDVYKLSDRVKADDRLAALFTEVREHRAKMKICPSAGKGVDLGAIIDEFCDNNFYEEDYKMITSYFANDMISYSDTIRQMKTIRNWIDTIAVK